MNAATLINRTVRNIYFSFLVKVTTFITYRKLYLTGTIIGRGMISRGAPILDIGLKATFIIGNNLNLNSGKHYNVIGGQQICSFVVSSGAELRIGNNVGMSNASIVCHKKIIIEDDVKIGGSVVIYDTDFHSLNSLERNHQPEIYNTIANPVIIKRGAFIGAHSIILKGTTIGSNAIIGAGSVVTCDIPDSEIWAGNPAKFIKNA